MYSGLPSASQIGTLWRYLVLRRAVGALACELLLEEMEDLVDEDLRATVVRARDPTLGAEKQPEPMVDRSRRDTSASRRPKRPSLIGGHALYLRIGLDELLVVHLQVDGERREVASEAVVEIRGAEVERVFDECLLRRGNAAADDKRRLCLDGRRRRDNRQRGTCRVVRLIRVVRRLCGCCGLGRDSHEIRAHDERHGGRRGRRQRSDLARKDSRRGAARPAWVRPRVDSEERRETREGERHTGCARRPLVGDRDGLGLGVVRDDCRHRRHRDHQVGPWRRRRWWRRWRRLGAAIVKRRAGGP